MSNSDEDEDYNPYRDPHRLLRRGAMINNTRRAGLRPPRNLTPRPSRGSDSRRGSLSPVRRNPNRRSRRDGPTSWPRGYEEPYVEPPPPGWLDRTPSPMDDNFVVPGDLWSRPMRESTFERQRRMEHEARERMLRRSEDSHRSARRSPGSDSGSISLSVTEEEDLYRDRIDDQIRRSQVESDRVQTRNERAGRNQDRDAGYENWLEENMFESRSGRASAESRRSHRGRR